MERQSSSAGEPLDSAPPSTPVDTHQNSIANGDIESQIKIEGNDAEGADTAVSAAQVPPTEKDFPDLAPSKSMDFPDGTLEYQGIFDVRR